MKGRQAEQPTPWQTTLLGRLPDTEQNPLLHPRCPLHRSHASGTNRSLVLMTICPVDFLNDSQGSSIFVFIIPNSLGPLTLSHMKQFPDDP